MKIIRSMFDKCIEAVSIGIFALMVLLVTFQVFVRYVLNSPSAFSETLTRYLFVWLGWKTGSYVHQLSEGQAAFKGTADG